MAKKEEYVLLSSIFQHCSIIINEFKKVRIDKFLKNQKLKDCICFNILQIGELVKRLSNEFKIKYSEIEWRKIMGLRNIIAHGYGTIDLNSIYYIAKFDIPILYNFCEYLLFNKI